MLYDELEVINSFDDESAIEFLKEATRLASTTEIEHISSTLMTKCNLFQTKLSSTNLQDITQDELVEVISLVFSVKRKSKRIVTAFGFDEIRDQICELLHGASDVGERFDHFVNSMSEVLDERRCINLAGELLHFSQPEKYWLWTNWIWDYQTGSGAIPMVIKTGSTLDGESVGEKYNQVGNIMKRLETTNPALTLSEFGRGPLATDLFLASIHAVYMYTVFRLKLSKEFNRILPDLPELVERVLGVRGMEVT